MLDALLASQPQVTCGRRLRRGARALQNFGGVKAEEPPAGFVGELRPYQKEGIGWLSFLRQFGFGGCLADDMGLGKTVQILALLEARRELREGAKTAAAPDGPPPEDASSNGNGRHSLMNTPPGPSLVVVPRSLVFNWKEEAAKFAPAQGARPHRRVARQDRRAGSTNST